MNYLALDSYPRKWIFTHASMPVPADDLSKIKPLSLARSAQLWRDMVSRQSPDADHFDSDDWMLNPKMWALPSFSWQEAWDADEVDLPAPFAEFIDWDDNVTVYFCYEKYNIVETQWGVLKRHWKNFLFFDNGPFLIGRRKSEVVWFQSDGTAQLGHRPLA